MITKDTYYILGHVYLLGSILSPDVFVKIALMLLGIVHFLDYRKIAKREIDELYRQIKISRRKSK